MRLIDADVLLKVFKELINAYRQIEGKHNWGDHCKIPAFEFIYALKSAKTIEAIPISWIEKQISLLHKEGYDADALYLEGFLKLWEDDRSKGETYEY